MLCPDAATVLREDRRMARPRKFSALVLG